MLYGLPKSVDPKVGSSIKKLKTCSQGKSKEKIKIVFCQNDREKEREIIRKKSFFKLLSYKSWQMSTENLFSKCCFRATL